MKKSIIFLSVVALAAAGSSCKLKKAVWPEIERKAFMDACIQPIADAISPDAGIKICDCALEKLEAKYKSPNEVSEEAARKIGEECAMEYIKNAK